MAILMKTQKTREINLKTFNEFGISIAKIKMSSGNRKAFDDDMSASPSSSKEASEIEETPNLTGVAEENSIDDTLSRPYCIDFLRNFRRFAKILTVAILLGILVCAWSFGFGNQIIEDFDRVYTLEREHGIVEQIKDWMVSFISSILNNTGFF